MNTKNKEIKNCLVKINKHIVAPLKIKSCFSVGLAGSYGTAFQRPQSDLDLYLVFNSSSNFKMELLAPARTFVSRSAEITLTSVGVLKKEIGSAAYTKVFQLSSLRALASGDVVISKVNALAQNRRQKEHNRLLKQIKREDYSRDDLAFGAIEEFENWVSDCDFKTTPRLQICARTLEFIRDFLIVGLKKRASLETTPQILDHILLLECRSPSRLFDYNKYPLNEEWSCVIDELSKILKLDFSKKHIFEAIATMREFCGISNLKQGTPVLIDQRGAS